MGLILCHNRDTALVKVENLEIEYEGRNFKLIQYGCCIVRNVYKKTYTSLDLDDAYIRCIIYVGT